MSQNTTPDVRTDPQKTEMAETFEKYEANGMNEQEAHEAFSDSDPVGGVEQLRALNKLRVEVGN